MDPDFTGSDPAFAETGTGGAAKTLALPDGVTVDKLWVIITSDKQAWVLASGSSIPERGAGDAASSPTTWYRISTKIGSLETAVPLDSVIYLCHQINGPNGQGAFMTLTANGDLYA